MVIWKPLKRIPALIFLAIKPRTALLLIVFDNHVHFSNKIEFEVAAFSDNLIASKLV